MRFESDPSPALRATSPTGRGADQTTSPMRRGERAQSLPFVQLFPKGGVKNGSSSSDIVGHLPGSTEVRW